MFPCNTISPICSILGFWYIKKCRVFIRRRSFSWWERPALFVFIFSRMCFGLASSRGIFVFFGMEKHFSSHSSERIAKAKKIKAIITDVDGVLTDGGIIYDNNGMEFKRFNVKDGQVVKALREQGLVTGVITGRNSEVVKFRCRELKFDFHHHGVKNKVALLEKELQERKLNWEEVAYIGDDLPDLCIFEKCGLSVLPSDGLSYLQKEVDWVTQAAGGRGVFREVADFILWAQGKLEDIIARDRLG